MYIILSINQKIKTVNVGYMDINRRTGGPKKYNKASD